MDHILPSKLFIFLSTAAVASAFDVPEGKPSFDYVFDFTGEVRHDRSEAVSPLVHFSLTNSHLR